MNHRTGVAAALAAATFSASLLASPAADAEDPHADHSRCVTIREYRGVYQQTRPALEKHWEVVGLGVHVDLPFGLVHEVIVYPRCGFTMDQAWYGITYKRRGKHLWAAWATECETWKTGTTCLAGM